MGEGFWRSRCWRLLSFTKPRRRASLRWGCGTLTHVARSYKREMKSRIEQAEDILSVERSKNLKSLDDIIAAITKNAQLFSGSEGALVPKTFKRKVRRISIDEFPQVTKAAELPLSEAPPITLETSTSTEDQEAPNKKQFQSRSAKKPPASALPVRKQNSIQKDAAEKQKKTVKSGNSDNSKTRKSNEVEAAGQKVETPKDSKQQKPAARAAAGKKRPLEAVIKRAMQNLPEPVAKNKRKKGSKQQNGEEYRCMHKGCTMVFEFEEELLLHRCCFCTFEGCGKRLCSHAHLIDHYRVHSDEMPFKCPWKGCQKRFKWKRAIPEHLRVHTRERPFVCKECGKTYRYAADFREHKQKKNH